MSQNQNIRIAVDAIVFGYQNNKVYALLIQQKFCAEKAYWALTGGLVQENETLKEAIQRELKEETNVEINSFEHLHTLGDDIRRDSRNRVISVAYFALVDSSKFKIKTDSDAENVQWFKINKIPELTFDHNLILKKAVERL